MSSNLEDALPPEPPVSRLGDGVPRVEPEVEKPPTEVEVEVEEQEPPKGESLWITTPSFADQYTNPKYAKFRKVEAPQVDVFNLGVREEKDAFNALLKRTIPATSPGIITKGEPLREFHGGAYIILFTYQTVLYKRLVPKETLKK